MSAILVVILAPPIMSGGIVGPNSIIKGCRVLSSRWAALVFIQLRQSASPLINASALFEHFLFSQTINVVIKILTSSVKLHSLGAGCYLNKATRTLAKRLRPATMRAATLELEGSLGFAGHSLSLQFVNQVIVIIADIFRDLGQKFQ